MRVVDFDAAHFASMKNTLRATRWETSVVSSVLNVAANRMVIPLIWVFVVFDFSPNIAQTGTVIHQLLPKLCMHLADFRGELLSVRHILFPKLPYRFHMLTALFLRLLVGHIEDVGEQGYHYAAQSVTKQNLNALGEDVR